MMELLPTILITLAVLINLHWAVVEILKYQDRKVKEETDKFLNK